MEMPYHSLPQQPQSKFAMIAKAIFRVLADYVLLIAVISVFAIFVNAVFDRPLPSPEKYTIAYIWLAVELFVYVCTWEAERSQIAEFYIPFVSVKIIDMIGFALFCFALILRAISHYSRRYYSPFNDDWSPEMFLLFLLCIGLFFANNYLMAYGSERYERLDEIRKSRNNRANSDVIVNV